MALSEKNALIAISKVGLDAPGPIHIDDYRRKFHDAARLAEMLDRFDRDLQFGAPPENGT